MKLSTKILVLITPAIMISTVVSSYIIFSIQKDALVKREDSYLQLRMEKLSSHFQRSASFLNSFAYSLTKNHVIEDYFNDHDNPYRELELIDTLQESVNALEDGNQTFINLAIFDGYHNLLYYAESSNDPFAEIDPALLQSFKKKAGQRPKVTYSGHTHNSYGEGMLMRYDMLDKRTGKSPLRFEPQNVFFVVVAVSLQPFNDLKRQIEFDTQSSIVFSNQQLLSNESYGAISTQLTKDIFITVDPARYLIENKIGAVWRQLTFSFSIAGMITVGVILLILFRYVIRPISAIDRQLQEVEKKRRRNIEKFESRDEIGRLSVRLYDMYEELDTTYQKTKILAERDSLTQLVNRRQFQVLASGILKNLDNKYNAWITYIDLDNFKFINDKYGHNAGDELLINFANHLLSLTQRYSAQRVNTIATRLSGDEFAVLIVAPEQCGDISQECVQEILSLSFSEQSLLSPHSAVTMSVGISSYPNDGTDIEKLLSCADAAMYQAKSKGKNGFAYYSEEINNRVQRLAAIEQALRSSDLEKQLSLHFQPYISRRSGQVVGVETLVRWYSPGLGHILPDEFIPLAEHKGVFDRVDRCVINKAFDSYNQLESIFGTGIKLSINLSSAGLNSTALASYIERVRKQYGIAPNLIEFEITETFSNENSDFPLLHQLSELGYHLAIDDFGSGFTSLTQLVQYPVQKIKFDRMFLNSLIETNNEHVIKPLIELCHSQEKLVTAEGIENANMHNWLMEHHCDFMQGYYYAKPMALQDLIEWHEQTQFMG